MHFFMRPVAVFRLIGVKKHNGYTRRLKTDDIRNQGGFSNFFVGDLGVDNYSSFLIFTLNQIYGKCL